MGSAELREIAINCRKLCGEISWGAFGLQGGLERVLDCLRSIRSECTGSGRDIMDF
jgi:hypothetical protein